MVAIVALSLLLSGFGLVVVRILSAELATAGHPVRNPWSPRHLRRVRKARKTEEEIANGPSWASFPRAF
ncbi:hypothetical protein [Azospirillum rugosum]|uniref:Secreted protein n=1 Tax=Azospirillum rugosum TaxID=416170 RepID=A0ABS4SFG6_9PROT|nr:hypothetical protein [Azospirillum rugosum]MBP2291237.1 hypothetical protein [Azospirillum rugosum]MDQ0524699.1 hypothetical protein [Azospirillum rugosum]